MTVVDGFIEMHGVDVTPYYEAKGAADSYGDRATTWTARAAEKAVIQPTRGMKWSHVFSGLAGAGDAADYICMLKSGSAVEAGDYLQVGAAKYEVVQIMDVIVFDYVSHREAYLKLMTEA